MSDSVFLSSLLERHYRVSPIVTTLVWDYITHEKTDWSVHSVILQSIIFPIGGEENGRKRLS